VVSRIKIVECKGSMFGLLGAKIATNRDTARDTVSRCKLVVKAFLEEVIRD